MEQIQTANPGAATPLHDRFAAGLRVLLRHRVPNADLETGVFCVLVAVARAVRKGNIQDDHHLLAEVRAAANSFIEDTVIPNASAAGFPVERIRREIGHLSSSEQEILFRFYHLEQTEGEIHRETGLTVDVIRKVKRAARQRFLRKK